MLDSRQSRLEWARHLYKRNFRAPKVHIRMQTVMTQDAVQEIHIRFETLGTVGDGIGYTVIADHYRKAINDLEELQDWIDKVSFAFNVKIETTEELFVTEFDSREHWFELNEIK